MWLAVIFYWSRFRTGTYRKSQNVSDAKINRDTINAQITSLNKTELKKENPKTPKQSGGGMHPRWDGFDRLTDKNEILKNNDNAIENIKEDTAQGYTAFIITIVGLTW